jgi:FtsP/CotA-like multicopper oxidase with cupredoxin domain
LTLVIYDIKLQENGSIYYHDPADIPSFTTWTPEYFGDIMTVNGRSWPFMNVQNKKYRLKISNTCNSRHLNLYFQSDSANTTYSNDTSNLPFYVIKKDSGYMNTPILKQV